MGEGEAEGHQDGAVDEVLHVDVGARPHTEEVTGPSPAFGLGDVVDAVLLDAKDLVRLAWRLVRRSVSDCGHRLLLVGGRHVWTACRRVRHEHPVGRNGLRQAGHGRGCGSLHSAVRRGEESEARKRFVGEELEPQGGQPLDFDLLAASLRADAVDAETFFRVLAAKLADALGDRVTLERAKGLRKKDRPATGLVVDLTSAGAGAVLSARQEHNDVDLHGRESGARYRLVDQTSVDGAVDRSPRRQFERRGPPFGENLGGPARAALMIHLYRF